MPNTRFYKVRDRLNPEAPLQIIEGTRKPQVGAYLAQQRYEITIANARDVNDAHKAGIECESAVAGDGD